MGFEVEGVEEICSHLQAIYDALEPDKIKAVLMPSAEQLRDLAKDLAPVYHGKPDKDTIVGWLRDNIFAVPGVPELPNVVVGVSLEKVPYALVVEIKEPYLRPAAGTLESSIIENIAAELWRLISEAR